MRKYDFEMLSKNEVIKHAPMVKVAEALLSMEVVEGRTGQTMTFDELEEFVEGWLVADLDSNGNDPAWKNYLESLAKR